MTKQEDEEDRFNRRRLRLERIFSRNRPFYFVTFNTSHRLPILARPDIHNAFREFCLRANEQYNVAVGRYVIMPDHLHLFVAFPSEGITLSKWVQSLRSILGKELLRYDFSCGAGSGLRWRLRSVICLIRAESEGLQVATSGSSLNALWTIRLS